MYDVQDDKRPANWLSEYDAGIGDEHVETVVVGCKVV